MTPSHDDHDSAISIPIAGNELPPDKTAQPFEHFIPLRKSDLVRLLTDDAQLSSQEREQLVEFCRLIDSAIHNDYHQRLVDLKDAYFPIDPDADKTPLQPLPLSDQHPAAIRVFHQFGSLLERANFRKLGEEEISSALTVATNWSVNLKADMRVFERLEVYARGDVMGKQIIHPWWKFYRAETVEVPTYQRLAMIFRLTEKYHAAEMRHSPTGNDTLELKRPIVLKLFKNIPKADLEMLLPGTRVRMSLLDQGKIWLPTLSGAGLAAIKLAKGAAMLAFGTLAGMLGFLSLVVGMLGYGAKAFFGYLNTKDKYHLNLTRNLYFQNLDNNAGVLFRLLDEAEEQEFREAVLAYWLLWREAGDGGWKAPQIDRAAERLLRERCGLQVDFEIQDALEKLRRLNLIEGLPGGKWRAIGVQAALAELDRQWDGFNTYHAPVVSRQLASKKHLLRALQAA